MSEAIDLILPVGTRVVIRNETNLIGGGITILSGAVGVVIETPTAAIQDSNLTLLPQPKSSLKSYPFYDLLPDRHWD